MDEKLKENIMKGTDNIEVVGNIHEEKEKEKLKCPK